MAETVGEITPCRDRYLFGAWSSQQHVDSFSGLRGNFQCADWNPLKEPVSWLYRKPWDISYPTWPFYCVHFRDVKDQQPLFQPQAQTIAFGLVDLVAYAHEGFFCYLCNRSSWDFLWFVAPKSGSAVLTLTTFGCSYLCRTLSMVHWLTHWRLLKIQLSTDHFPAGPRKAKTWGCLKANIHLAGFLVHPTPEVKMGHVREMV